MAKSEIKGLKELERAIARLGKLPQKHVNKAARKGATIALKAARNNAPYETGELKKGIILKGEKRTKPGKKVFDVMMDPAKNDIFQKKTKTGMRVRRLNLKGSKYAIKNKGNYYYPASMEYGFFTRNGRYIPGDRFLKKSLTENNEVIESTIIDVLATEIDKELRKGR